MEDQLLLRRPLPPKCIPLSCSREPCEPESTFVDMISTYIEPIVGTRKSFITDWEHFYKTKKLRSKKKRKAVLDQKPKHCISVFHNILISAQADPSIPEDDPRYYTPPKFTLDDFLLKFDHRAHALKEAIIKTQPIYSTYNHHRLVNLIISNVLKSQQTEVNKVKLSIDYIPMPLIQIPQRQLSLELAAVIKDYMRTHLIQEQKHFKSGLRKELTGEEKHLFRTFNHLPVYPGQGKIIRSPSMIQQFYESQYNYSSFERYKSIRKLSDSEVAVQDSLKKGGILLNLRAHFIHHLPDIIVLIPTLKYLNMSFNYFTTIPHVVYDLHELQILNIRDNPIRKIPPGIEKLTKLKVFDMSFCLLSTLPLGIFLLLELESLNFAYNYVSIIPNEIRNLSKLQVLNAEGNQLFALPQGLLKLHIKQLRLESNFLHPLLWLENSKNKPQKLSHLAARVFIQNNLQQHYTDIPKHIQSILNSATVCECCGGPMCGPGLRIIRPCKKIFGVENLPFLFHSCAPSCKTHFMMQTESLINLIYQ